MTAAEINERFLGAFLSGLRPPLAARCKREGVPVECDTCHGEGDLERWPGQEALADAWEPFEPPTGDGWQMWETTSEGSPMSPVFATADELADWCTANLTAFGAQTASREWWGDVIAGGWDGVQLGPGVYAC